MESKRTAWALAALTATMLLMVIMAATPVAAAGVPAGTGAIAGKVFFDANGDGQIASNGAESGIPSVTIQLLGASSILTATTDANGNYLFSGLAAGTYTVTVQPPADYVTTTATDKPVSVGSSLVADAHFGLAYPISLWGALCQDLNADGMCGLATVEPRIAGALVQVFNDANRNGLIDLGEGVVADAVSSNKGLYLLTNLRPGSRILVVRLPGGAESRAEALSLQSDEAGATTFEHDFAIGLATLQGVVFNDVNGDEWPDAAEPGIRDAVVQLLAAASGQAVTPATVVATATTGTDGRYVFANVLAASYQVRVYSAPVPPDWLQSPDPSALIRALPAGVTTTLNIGFFNPAVAPPMSVADWKRELRQADRWAYTASEVAALTASAESGSRVFSETATLRDALLLDGSGSLSPAGWRALKEHAALWLNLASGRLRPETTVNLGSLSTASTVRQARDQIEALLLRPSFDADLEQAFAIARALNTAQGVGSRRTAVSAVVDAVSRGAQVASKLRPGGDIVDLRTNEPLTLRKWSVGSFGATTNTLLPKIRLRVKSFNEGGVLDAFQVFPDGRRLRLGTIQSAVQNRDVNKVYQLDLARVTTVAEMINATIVLTVRDVNGGKPASIKLDSAEIVFGY